MSSNTSLNIIKKINLNRLLNNSKLNYFLILILALFIGCYHLLNRNIRNGITNFVTMPLILAVVMIIILSIGYHNITLGLLMATTLFIILYPLDSILPSKTTNNITEGFANKKLKTSNKRYQEHENDRQQTIGKFKNYLRDIFDEALTEEKEEMEDMIKENLKTKLEHERSNNSKSENFEDVDNSSKSKSKKIKESMSDVINSSSKSNKYIKSNSKFQTIKVRNFDPTSDEDTNLLITKEILEDVINRITFQYESNDYLKRYISTRLQEIVRLNGLLNLDGDEDD
jgi:hypothetical protein